MRSDRLTKAYRSHGRGPTLAPTPTKGPCNDLTLGTAPPSAYPLDADSAFIASRPISWSSDQPAIVVVDDTGGVSGQALGTATITAEAGGVSGSTFITVSPPEIGFGGPDTARFAAIQVGRQGGKAAGRQGGRVAGWQGGRVAGWQGGRVAGWQGGRAT